MDNFEKPYRKNGKNISYTKLEIEAAELDLIKYRSQLEADLKLIESGKKYSPGERLDMLRQDLKEFYKSFEQYKQVTPEKTKKENLDFIAESWALGKKIENYISSVKE